MDDLDDVKIQIKVPSMSSDGNTSNSKLTFITQKEVSDASSNTEAEELTEELTDISDELPLAGPSGSSWSSLSSDGDICRICHCGKDKGRLIRPCRCDGSSKYAHEQCVLSWFQETQNFTCEVCLYPVEVTKKGLKQWKRWRCPPRAREEIAGVTSVYAIVIFLFVFMVMWISTKGCLQVVCILFYISCLLAIVFSIWYCGCVDYIQIHGRRWLILNERWRILEYDPEKTYASGTHELADRSIKRRDSLEMMKLTPV